jgi:hypothetical protein
VDSLTYDELERLLGIAYRVDVPCPLCGPACSTKRNATKNVLRVWSKDEAITYNCARCGAKGLGTPDGPVNARPPRPPPRAAPPSATDAERTAYATSIWHDARDIRGTLAETYLRSRSIRIDEDLSHVLRFHPRLYYDRCSVAGMLALMRDAATDEPRAIHRTFLDDAGRKLDRRMYGPAKGAAIKLDANEYVVSGLHIGEGIETCLSARQLGYRPAWALGSAGAIAHFPVLVSVDALTVFAENDDASARASRHVRERYELSGAEAYEAKPLRGDFNDIVKDAA